MKSFVTVAALILSCAAMSGDDTDADGSDLRIDIGRLGIINDKTREIWQKLRSDEHPGRPANPVAMNAWLRSTVWQFNELREDMCNDRFMVESSCGPPYVPTGALNSARVVPSAAELRRREAELADQVVPLWDAACDRLRRVIADEAMGYCSIE
jgi:hypothetical protein